MVLHAARIDSAAGKDGAKVDLLKVTLASSRRGEVFADAGTDSSGRVWVAWQSFRDGQSDIYVRNCEPAGVEWGKEIRITTDAANDWEPRLAFCKDGAAVVFDSCRDGDYNVYLAQVSPDGEVKLTQVSNSPRYEARASIAASADSKGYYVAYESGREKWGHDTRSVNGSLGLNFDKRICVAYVDSASGKVTPVEDPTPVLRSAILDAKSPMQVVRVNLPKIAVDSLGRPWLACRLCVGMFWQIGVTRYDTATKTWSKPEALPDSTFSQDRNCAWSGQPSWLAWPSDKRTNRNPRLSGVYLAKMDTAVDLPAVAAVSGKAKKAAGLHLDRRFGDDTPQRLRSDRHAWAPAGTKYELYWGEFHRHSDISACRQASDGCIVEQYRYALDVGRLDFLGPTDHTDQSKVYTPYEWWCNQKLADVFHSPGFFNTFYAYEREQPRPWGHRNVIFAQRGGPIVYVNRNNYKASPWQATLPVGDGPVGISPSELWSILRQHGKPATVITHTGATHHGTDWDGYDHIDHDVENVVEIFQGARLSYEGAGTPQPSVGLAKDNPRIDVGTKVVDVTKAPDFGKYANGTYQNALRKGRKLGVFASSDHISANVSFGGVYVESFTREGIIKAINERRTIAGTDKIFIDFSCNGQPLGSIFETTEKPTLKIAVNGTAKLKAVTIVRNETDFKRFTPNETSTLETAFTDEAPVAGENRYYIRVEQVDGNMAWTSPVWVAYKAK